MLPPGPPMAGPLFAEPPSAEVAGLLVEPRMAAAGLLLLLLPKRREENEQRKSKQGET